MGGVKNLLIEAESMLVNCLDEWGMTNEQAFTKIGNELGSIAEHHVRELVKHWNEGETNAEYEQSDT